MAEFGSGSIQILADRDPGGPKRNRSNGFGSVTQFDQVIQLLFKRNVGLYQCCGSGSGPVGSVCFWSHGSGSISQKVWIRVLLSISKNSKKNLDSYCFVTSFWHFIFAKLCTCTVPFKSNKKKNLKKFFLAFLRSMTKIIRIHWSEAWIRGSRSGSGSTPKCHGSATLVFMGGRWGLQLCVKFNSRTDYCCGLEPHTMYLKVKTRRPCKMKNVGTLPVGTQRKPTHECETLRVILIRIQHLH